MTHRRPALGRSTPSGSSEARGGNHDERYAIEEFGYFCVLAGAGLGLLVAFVVWRI